MCTRYDITHPRRVLGHAAIDTRENISVIIFISSGMWVFEAQSVHGEEGSRKCVMMLNKKKKEKLIGRNDSLGNASDAMAMSKEGYR